MKSTNFSRANELFREGRYDDAIPIYRECIEHDPKFHPYHDNLVAALEKLGRHEEADQARKSAAELRPGSRVTGNTSEAVSARTAQAAAEPVHTRVMREEGWEEDPAVKPMLNARRENDEVLKRQYEASSLAAEPDTFVLYRIIGNDLYPRHEKGQSRKNVRFILENEPELEGCEKRWLLNRIFDAEEREAIIELLEQHEQSYLEIPFESEAFAQIGWDYSAFPEPGYLSSSAFHGLELHQQRERAITAVYREKNLYLMNNNGARNAALEDGQTRAKWVLPWDGNCFVSESGWWEIRAAVRAEPHVPYYIVPMQRITDNAELLQDDFSPNPVEEPQLLFRRDARSRFGENHPYGRRPKVELFWRLGIPGKWDSWKDDPWEQPRSEPSPDFGAWGVAGWVARLASGKADLEASTTESFKNRGRERQKAIRTTINHVTRQVSAQPDPIGLTCYRFEPIEALQQEYQHQGEVGPQSELLQTLLANGAEALERQPESPADKPEAGPSGDLRDYYHPAPYWWPNPDTKDGLPYVRRDGERVPGTRMYEPESHRYDRTRLQRLIDDSTTLSLATFVTGNQAYAHHAVRWLERWFIDPETRMNPHLTYAQVRWGHNRNRGTSSGVIEMKDFYYYLDAVRLLRHLGALSREMEHGLQEWLREYLEWLLTSEQGTKEAQARNNHGTYYDLQVAAIAAFLEDDDTLYATLARAEERIPLQISPTGYQHEEMSRTNTAHYCCFTLQGWLNLLNLAVRFDGTLVKRAVEPTHPLRMAVKWLAAYEYSPWPYQQLEPFDSQRFVPLAHLAAVLGLREDIQFGPNQSQSLTCFAPHDGIAPYWYLLGVTRPCWNIDAETDHISIVNARGSHPDRLSVRKQSGQQTSAEASPDREVNEEDVGEAVSGRASMRLLHVVVIRFAIGIYDERWLEHRFGLFESFTVPSLREQSWPLRTKCLIQVDSEITGFWEQRIREATKDLPVVIQKLSTHADRKRGLREFCSEKAEFCTTHVLTTRLDDDDGVAQGSFESVRECAHRIIDGGYDLAAIAFRQVIRYEPTESLMQFINVNEPDSVGLSLLAPVNSKQNIWGSNHKKIAEWVSKQGGFIEWLEDSAAIGLYVIHRGADSNYNKRMRTMKKVAKRASKDDLADLGFNIDWRKLKNWARINEEFPDLSEGRATEVLGMVEKKIRELRSNSSASDLHRKRELERLFAIRRELGSDVTTPRRIEVIREYYEL